MKINAVSSYNNSMKYTVNNSTQAQQSFNGHTLLRNSHIMKGLALAGMLAMATAMMNSCAQPTGPDYYMPITTEQPENPDTPTAEQPENPGNPDVPTAEQPENPTNPTIPTGGTEETTSVQDMNIYKAFSSLGIIPTTEKVTVPEGHYQPKTGDILEIGFTTLDQIEKIDYKYTIDTQNSKEDELKYKGEYQNEMFENDKGDIPNTVIVNKKEKSITFIEHDIDYTRKFIWNNDGTLTCIEVNTKGTKSESKLYMDKETSELKNKSNGGQRYGNIFIKLAE